MSNIEKVKNPELLNGVRQNKLHPTTFHIPSKEEIDILKVGDLIKVAADGERFWVQITEVNPRKYIGRIDNDLVKSDLHELYFNDLITFKQENIINIY